MLKIRNEQLSAKLRKAEIIISRIKEELARLRASTGGKPCIDFDEEQRLRIKLKVSFLSNVLRYKSLNIMDV